MAVISSNTIYTNILIFSLSFMINDIISADAKKIQFKEMEKLRILIIKTNELSGDLIIWFDGRLIETDENFWVDFVNEG